VAEGQHGAHAKYILPDEDRKAKVELTWLGEGENGIACNLDSIGYKALLDATESVLGKCTPYSIGGSLPLVRELQDSGYDVQISGYGFSSRYHADNEAVSLESMKNATKIIGKIISLLNP
jgi:acetylornithine deacetylase